MFAHHETYPTLKLFRGSDSSSAVHGPCQNPQKPQTMEGEEGQICQHFKVRQQALWRKYQATIICVKLKVLCKDNIFSSTLAFYFRQSYQMVNENT